MPASGEQVRSFHRHDELAIRHAISEGYRVVVIPGRSEKGVRRRLHALDVTDGNLFPGVPDKVAVLTQWVARAGLTLTELAYMGDDLPDLAALQPGHLPGRRRGRHPRPLCVGESPRRWP